MTALVTLTPEEKTALLDVCIDRENFHAVAQADDRSWTLFEKSAACRTHENRVNISFIGVIPPCTAIYANCYIQRPTADKPTVRILVASVANGNRFTEESVSVMVSSLAGNR